MDSDLPVRLLAEARRCLPATATSSRLVPFREALLTFRAKRLSHEKIATILKQHGVQIERTAVGDYCRRFCPAADIERVRRDLIADLLDLYGETVRWLVVRNLRDGADSSVFMASKTRQRLLALDIPEHVRLGRFL